MPDRADQIREHLPSLRRYARALTRDADLADELVQDSVVRALAKWPLFRRRDNLRAWLFTIMHNVHVNAAKRRTRTAMRSLDADPLPARAVAAAQGHAVALGRLAAALDALPDDQRRVVLLVGLEGFSYAEAASITGVPLGTVMSRLSRARDRLRRLTEGEEGEETTATDRIGDRGTAPPHLKRIK